MSVFGRATASVGDWAVMMASETRLPAELDIIAKDCPQFCTKLLDHVEQSVEITKSAQWSRDEVDILREVLRHLLHEIQTIATIGKAEFTRIESEHQEQIEDLKAALTQKSIENFELQNRLTMLELLNRNLTDLNMDLKGNVRVYGRIRPSIFPSATPSTKFRISSDRTSLSFLDPHQSVWDSSEQIFAEFKLNGFFGPEMTNNDVHGEVQPFVRRSEDNLNIGIIAYGRTASGKSHTLLSKDDSLIPLIFHALRTQAIETGSKIKYRVLEIYMNQPRNLLDDERGGSFTEACAEDIDVQSLISIVRQKRLHRSTTSNDVSSRSHLIFTIQVSGISNGEVNFVDLAGHERYLPGQDQKYVEAVIEKYKSAGNSAMRAKEKAENDMNQRHREMVQINTDLGEIKSMIAKKRQTGRSNAIRSSTYRSQSILPELLQSMFEEQAKALVLVHISEDDDVARTKAVLGDAIEMHRATTSEMKTQQPKQKNPPAQHSRTRGRSRSVTLGSAASSGASSTANSRESSRHTNVSESSRTIDSRNRMRSGSILEESGDRKPLFRP